MRTRLPFAALLIALLAPHAWGYGVTHNAGLRAVEKTGPAELTLTFGPALRPQSVDPKRAWFFQVASETDKDFNLGVNAAAAEVVKKEPDGAYPDGYAGPRFEKYTLKVTLPADKPLKDGRRYWLRVNSSGIAAFNRRAKYVLEPGKVPAEDLAPRYGIRETYALSTKALHLVTGAGLDTAKLADSSHVKVTSADDPDYKDGVSPARISRRSNLDFYIPDGWPWRFHQRHELFLLFEKPFKNGKTYRIDLNAKPGAPLTCGTSAAELKFDDREALNLALKVNQYGWRPDAPRKYAYLGMWMGELNAYDFAAEAAAFEVRDAKTHEVVLKGAPALRRKATYKLEGGQLTPDPKQTPGPETVYKQDLSYEDAYELDLSELNKEGAYYVALPGMGRSFEFRIGSNVYLDAFKVAMNGIYHQRSGIDLKAPWTGHYQPAGHRNHTEYSTQRHKEFADAKFATDGKKHDLWGGHHDAGDWDPRSHLDIAQHLFLLYELNPDAFADGQLNIPENANGLPDVLDEGHWALDLWTRLQDEDGGVHHGIEATADPKEGDTPATDTLREFAYAKDSTASYYFAAVAAHASLLWRKNGKAGQADAFLERALKAWDWGQAHPEQDKNYQIRERNQLVFAAAVLLRATGEARFDEAFRKSCIFAENPKAPPLEYQKWDHLHGGFQYLLAEKGDASLKDTIRESFEGLCRYWIGAAETTTYRYLRSPFAPNSWGTGGLPTHSLFPALARHATKDEKLKASITEWLTYTNDFTLGCHPMNLTFTVGLGQRYVHHAFSHLQCNSPAGLVAGLQSEGPSRGLPAGPIQSKSMADWPAMSLYPLGPWPELYRFSEQASPGMAEGVVLNQGLTAFAYGLFLAPAKK
ncbi:MAG: glycoside hydrolase family 9 protein [Planctomycetota bacterium]|nr:glycoside hydrolase family 9 protein [Planctomycetota bacterium]